MNRIIDTIPAVIGVDGHVLIETFDAVTGKKKAETEGHNLFTNYGLERFRKYCSSAIGVQFGKNVYYHEDLENEVFYANSNVAFGLLKYLFLTDNASAISATDTQIPGNLTGWATRATYAGTDVTRGSINLNETRFFKNGLKAVFDFGTDKGNGTHRSIFWSDQASLTAYNMLSSVEPHLSTGESLASSYVQIVESNDGYLYGCVGTSLYKIDPTTYAELATYTLPATPTNNSIFDVFGGYCYFCTAHNSTTLYVYRLSDGTNSTLTLPGNSGGNGGAVIDGYLYYPYSSTRIYKYNLSAGTGVYNTVTLSGSGCYIVRNGSNIYLIDSSANLYSYDYATNTLTNLNRAVYTTYLRSTHSTANKLLLFRGLNSKYDGSATNLVNALFTHSLTQNPANMITGKVLDAPVTKNNTQTMKVTYTISFV